MWSILTRFSTMFCGINKTQICLFVFFLYLKLFEENLGERLPEVRRAEDGLDDDHSSVARVHQQVPDCDKYDKL